MADLPITNNIMTPGDVFEKFREIPEKQFLVHATYYSADLDQSVIRFMASDEFKHTQELIKQHSAFSGGLMLDVGGGNGVASLAFEKIGYTPILLEPDDHYIVGYSAAQPILEQGQSKMIVLSAYGEKIPLPDNSIELVYTRQVLHHLTDLDAFTKEVYRVLKPGGVYLAAREHVINQHKDIHIFWKTHTIHRYTLGEFAYLLSEYEDAIRVSGLRLICSLSPYHSPISYFPTTTKEFMDGRIKGLEKRFGKSIAKVMMSNKLFKSIILGLLARRNSTPGRMYSFVAKKNG